VILDSSFLLDLTHEKEATITKATEIEQANVPIHIPAVAVYELYYGVEYLDKGREERERLNRVFDRYPIVEPGRAIMHKSARIDAHLDASGRALDDLADVMIGATGAVRGEPVLTRNVDHFERMPDVDVSTY
jgi:predicted nucleic acid-binding protein